MDKKQLQNLHSATYPGPEWKHREATAFGAARAAAAPPATTEQTDDDTLVVDTTPRQAAMDIKDGIYRVKLAALDEEPNPFDEGKRRWLWKFGVEGQEGTLHFYSSVGRGPRMEEALTALQVPFAKNSKTSLKKSGLLGRTCMGRVENITTNGGGVTFPRLKQLFPAVS